MTEKHDLVLSAYMFLDVVRELVVVVSVGVEPELGGAVDGGAEGGDGRDGEDVVADVGRLHLGEGRVAAKGVAAGVRAHAELCNVQSNGMKISHMFVTQFDLISLPPQ